MIHGPSNYAYDIDIGAVTINDYYHADYFTILQGVVGTDLADENAIRPPSDNNLINGKMNFACSNSTGTSTTGNSTTGNSTTTTGLCVNNAGLSKFRFTSGKKYRLRLINTGVQAVQKFSIDNHKMTIIANDFIPVEPYEATIVTLGVSSSQCRCPPSHKDRALTIYRSANALTSSSKPLAIPPASFGCAQ